MPNYVLKEEMFTAVKKRLGGTEVYAPNTVRDWADEEDKKLAIETIIKILGQDETVKGAYRYKIGCNPKPASKTKVEQFLEILLNNEKDVTKQFNKKDFPTAYAVESKSERTNINQQEKDTELVQKIRDKVKAIIIERCKKVSLMKVLEPVDLDSIYVELNPTISIPSNIKKKIEIFKLRLLLVGSLGIGKTTYLKQLALQIIGEDKVIGEDEKKKVNEENSTFNNQVPFFINLRDYFESTKKKPITLLEFIANSYGFTSESDKNSLINILKGEKDQCVLLLDSLDQFSDEESNDLIRDVLTFIEQYPQNDYILSSRDNISFAKLQNFEIFNLAGIDITTTEEGEKQFICKNTIEDFIRKRIVKLEISKRKADEIANKKADEIANEIANKILDALNKNSDIREIISKPLMLELICLKYSYDYSQNNDPELIQDENEWCIVHNTAKIWLKDHNQDLWDNERDDVNSFINQDFIYDLIEFIAFKAISDGITNILRTRLLQYITIFIKERYDWSDKLKLEQSGQQVVQFLKNTYGISLIRKENSYCFFHTIFKNYFAIRYILHYEGHLSYKRSVESFKSAYGENSPWDNFLKTKFDDFPESLKEKI